MKRDSRPSLDENSAKLGTIETAILYHEMMAKISHATAMPRYTDHILAENRWLKHLGIKYIPEAEPCRPDKVEVRPTLAFLPVGSYLSL